MKIKNKQFRKDWTTSCVKLVAIIWRYKMSKIINENPKESFE